MRRLPCPSCRAPLRVNPGQRSGQCPACGAILGVRQGVRRANPSRRVTPATAAAATALARAKQCYERFHGTPPHQVRKVQRPPNPGAAVLLGDLESLVYRPPKTSERGTDEHGNPIDWVHKSGDIGLPGPLRHLRVGTRPKLYASADGKQLMIVGGTQVTDFSRGIVG